MSEFIHGHSDPYIFLHFGMDLFRYQYLDITFFFIEKTEENKQKTKDGIPDAQ